MNIEAFYKEAGILLEPIGNRWHAPCPFHHEQVPSFVVYGDGGYHCFGCGAHGTAKDIQHRFNLDYRPFPDLCTSKDPLITQFSKIKSKMEDELNLLVVDEDTEVKFKAYDMFDQLLMDARSLIDNLETSLIDLIAFTKKRFTAIEKSVKKKVT